MDERWLKDVHALTQAVAQRLGADAPFRLKVLVQMLLIELKGLRDADSVPISSERRKSHRA